MLLRIVSTTVLTLLLAANALAEEQNQPPEDFTALFDGKTLDGWWGWGTKHYKHYADLDSEALAKLQEQSRGEIRKHWSVEDGELVN
ncbi:MAG: DUF1080 domain-containing protein, partial [Pirellulales bacterium]|nr:DUF1080 domain-containing protein [Pirellulales bacterium]